MAKPLRIRSQISCSSGAFRPSWDAGRSFAEDSTCANVASLLEASAVTLVEVLVMVETLAQPDKMTSVNRDSTMRMRRKDIRMNGKCMGRFKIRFSTHARWQKLRCRSSVEVFAAVHFDVPLAVEHARRG